MLPQYIISLCNEIVWECIKVWLIRVDFKWVFSNHVPSGNTRALYRKFTKLLLRYEAQNSQVSLSFACFLSIMCLLYFIKIVNHWLFCFPIKCIIDWEKKSFKKIKLPWEVRTFVKNLALIVFVCIMFESSCTSVFRCLCTVFSAILNYWHDVRHTEKVCYI